MKLTLLILIIFCATVANGQAFQGYKDAVNNFSINVPVGWKYGVPQNQTSIKFMASRSPVNANDTVKNTFNINILNTPNLDLEKTYGAFFKSISTAKQFKVLDNGTTIINGTKYKWLIESHTNKYGSIQMINYIFLTYKSEKTYILTMASFDYSFPNIKHTYTKIANSLDLFD